MKSLLFVPFLIFTLFAAMSALAAPEILSWYYNDNAGFGIYQPEGWIVRENGRSSSLIGPENDLGQSLIFIGSDWIGGVKNLQDLERYLQGENGSAFRPTHFSELDGFRSETAQGGEIYLLRQAENVIVIRFELLGSPAQREEAETMLSSIEIRRSVVADLKEAAARPFFWKRAR